MYISKVSPINGKQRSQTHWLILLRWKPIYCVSTSLLGDGKQVLCGLGDNLVFLYKSSLTSSPVVHKGTWRIESICVFISFVFLFCCRGMILHQFIFFFTTWLQQSTQKLCSYFIGLNSYTYFYSQHFLRDKGDNRIHFQLTCFWLKVKARYSLTWG